MKAEDLIVLGIVGVAAWFIYNQYSSGGTNFNRVATGTATTPAQCILPDGSTITVAEGTTCPPGATPATGWETYSQ